MRDFEKSGRSEALGSNGMAATSHPLATLTALDLIRSGGNAVDAAVAAIALLGVVEPTQTGIGGDCFVLLMREGRAQVVGLNGSGWAPAAASPDAFQKLGIASIATESAHAVTVPGAVATWARILDDYGTRDLASLLQPAIAAAEDGYPVTERVARDWAKQVDKLRRNPASSRTFLFDGAAPTTGTIHRQPTLATVLRSIAKDGPEVFYDGWIARDMVATLKALGGLHDLDDFSAFKPEYVEPICADYRGFTLLQCPPNGQGLTSLIVARTLDGVDLRKWGPNSVERYHLVAEAARQAYAERDAFIGDPRTDRVPVAALLSSERAAKRRALIDPARRQSGLIPVPLPDHRDTTFVAVVDRDRNAVAFINSIFDDFGSGITTPDSGIIFHNRAGGFVLEPGHPNAIAGRKRPLQTIIPAMLAKNDRAVMPFGVTGGHFQPIGQMQILSNVLDYDMGIQAAIDEPRILARGDSFEVEGTIEQDAVAGLRARGHAVKRAENPLGTAQAIWIDWERGLLRGGADGRRDSVALGF
jgi:gamma-glutamyltranspeptidase / glutathione hydrolase